MQYDEAVARLNRAGSDRQERGEIFAALITDEQLHEELAGMDRRSRQSAMEELKAALNRASSMQPLRDAVTEAMRQQMKNRGGGRCLGMPMPDGYTIDDGRIILNDISSKGEPIYITVAEREIAITGVVYDSTDRSVHVEVSWRTQDRGEIDRAVVPRLAVADSRTMVSTLASAGRDGAPVNSRNAAHLVSYFAEQESAAGHNMPRARLARALGWVSGEELIDPPRGFLSGHTLCHDGARFDVRQDWTDDHVVLHQSPGLLSLADRVHSRGTMGQWADIMREPMAFPVVSLCVMAGLAPVLLAVVPTTDSAGILDISGPPGTGKTRAVEFGACSLWGPASSQHGPCISLSGSEAGTRDYMMSCGSLPLLLNDSQHLRHNKERLGLLPYMLFEGQGQVLSAGNGSTRALRSSRNGAIITGESPLIWMADEAAGLRQRVLTVTERAWGARNEDTRALIVRTRMDLKDHYGHLGPAFASHVDARRDLWDAWRRAWADRARYFATMLGYGAERAAEVIALYELAGSIAQRDLGVRGINIEGATGTAMNAASTSVADADIGERALKIVCSWAMSNARRFAGRVDAPPAQGWLGRWDNQPGAELCLLKGPVCDFLERRNLPVDAVLSAWAERDWLSSTADRRTKNVRLDGKRPSMYCLTPEAQQCGGIQNDTGRGND